MKKSNDDRKPVLATDSYTAFMPAKTRATSSLWMGMMIAVREPSAAAEATGGRRSAGRREPSSTQVPTMAIQKEMARQAKSGTNSARKAHSVVLIPSASSV